LALKRLERSAVKVARSVLMGRGYSNVALLPDKRVGRVFKARLNKWFDLISKIMHLEKLPGILLGILSC